MMGWGKNRGGGMGNEECEMGEVWMTVVGLGLH